MMFDKTMVGAKLAQISKKVRDKYTSAVVFTLMHMSGVLPPIEAQAGDLSDIFGKISTISRQCHQSCLLHRWHLLCRRWHHALDSSLGTP